MQILTTAPAIVNATRTFRVLEAPTDFNRGLVRVRLDGTLTDYAFDIRRGGDGDLLVSLKRLEPEAPESLVVIGRDGAPDVDGWQADLAVALVKEIDRRAAPVDVNDRRDADLLKSIVSEYKPAPALARITCRKESPVSLVIGMETGRPLCVIICDYGISPAHERVGQLLAEKPELLAYPRALRACLDQIPGTTVNVA